MAVAVVSTTSTRTAGVPVNVQLYRVSLGITDPSQPPGAPWLTEPDLLVTELATTLPDTDVLVGLDVLLGYKLMLEGPVRRFWLEI